MKDLALLWALIVSCAMLGSVNGQDLCDCGTPQWEDPLSRIVQIDQGTHQFIDEFGRTRWFHGTNVVSKSFPYHPDVGGEDVCNSTLPTPLCDADMDYLQRLGVNVVRLGVMWPGAEPVRGVYNCTYFCVIHGIIQSLAGRGIYTLIDVHQDVMARQFCQEGVPDWFVQKDWISNDSWRFPYPQAKPFTTDENGIPDPWSQCWAIGANWFLSYFTIAVNDAFDRLYSNHDGLLDSFANYWAKIAMEFKDYKSVLGYNLLNEPWPGNVYKDPTLLIPGVADGKNLFPVWERLTSSIRSVDDETLIFFEGVTWDIVDGHPQVPGGNGAKSALSYHFYAPPQLGLHSMFLNRLRDHERLETGGILTEFRMWAGEGEEDKELIDRRMRDTVEAADKYLQSWMGWGYRSIKDLNVSVRRHYARTYAPAVAGTLLATGFNEDTSDFFAVWEVNKTNTEGTEVNLNRPIYYQDGFEVRVTPSTWAKWEVNEAGGGLFRIKIEYLEEAVQGQNITVRIIPTDPTFVSTTPSGNSSSLNVRGGMLVLCFQLCMVFSTTLV